MPSIRKRFELLIFGALVAFALVVPALAAAAPPAIKFEKRQPKTALLGTKQKVELVAENPEGQVRGYNLTFRDVLPVGVAYAGGASVAPTIIGNKPAAGQTTLLFENVSDLSPRSSFAVSFEVEPSKEIFKLAGNKNKYTDEAESFISEKPRRKPNFEKSGAKEGQWTETEVEKEKIAVVKKSASTELTAIEITKSEPSPEGELLRGVHEHQTVYTLTVKNNHVGPTEGVTGKGAVGKSNKSIIVEDWLPAGLEFLGCGKTDNTTNTTTNPGSAEEYPGSGVIDPGHAPTAEGCIEPFYVKTELTDPPSANLPEGTYTHVKWEGPESIVTSGEFKIRYVAAIPLLKNTTTWLGAEPAAEGGGVKQIANLDNNSGGETVDEEPLVNNAQAKARYEGVEVKDEDELERTAEDLAIQKGTNQPQIFDGAESNWTLRLETSEYRRSEPVSITDQLPNGLCPIGPKNYEEPGEANQPKAECAASATRHPTVRYLKGGPSGKVGTEEQIEYSLAKELATGGFELKFLGPEVAALNRMEPSQELLITFPTTTRVFYQSNFKDAKPILTGDSWTNKVSSEAPSSTRCYVEKTPGSYEADPNCEKPGTKPIASVRADGTKVLDISSAGQEAGGVEIEKSVRKNEGAVPTQCTDSSPDYVKGLLSKEAALPKYRPGDQICWRLVVRFPSNVYAGKPVVSDFIPTDEELVPNSAVEGPSNTVEYTFNEEAAKEEVLEWTLGKAESVESSKVFEVRFKTKVATTTTSEPGEISGNLMKFLYSNTAGVTFPLRDRSEIVRQEPNLELTKKVLSVNGGAAATIVKGADKVKYGIQIPNTKGTLKAEEIEVRDNLPAGTTCANIVEGTISNGGTCINGRIVWTGLSVEAGATGEVTYTMVVPADVAPGHKYENTAGVVKFKGETNTGEKFTYVPTNNIAGAEAGIPNAGEARGSAAVTTTAATVTKAAETPLVQEGNSKTQATIGELVKYTVTAKVPANSTLYGTPVLKDTIPAGLEFEKGSAKAEIGTEKIPVGGFTLVENETVGAVTSVQVNFPATYETGATEGKLTLTFNARVKNISTNVRGVEITNNAILTFKDKVVKEGETAPTREAKGSVKTPVVEPELKVYKTQSTAGTVKPGEVITYTVSAEDVAGRAAANNVKLVDTVPLGMKIVGGTEGGVYNSVARTITWELGTVNPGAVSAANTRSYKLEVENPAKAASVFKNEVVGTTQSLPPAETAAPGRTATFKEGTYEAAKSGYEASAKQESRLTGTTIVKEVAPVEGTIGTPLRYTLRLKLLPGIQYFKTTVVDTLPDGVAFDKTISTEIVEGASKTAKGELLPASPEGTPQRLGWFFGSLGSSENEREAVVVFEAHVKGKTSGGAEVKKGAELVNSVVGLYNGEQEKPKEAEERPTTVPTPGAGSGFAEQTLAATAKTTVKEPALAIVKSVEVLPGGGAGPKVQPGSSFRYKVVVTNSGNWPAYNAKVTDTNPQADLRNIVPMANPAATVLTANPLSWEIATIPAGGSVTLEYTAELAPSSELENGDAIDNVAAIPSYFGVPKAERKEGVEYRPYVGNEATVALNVALPKLVLTKTVGPKGKVALIGEEFEWRLKVENTSTVAAVKGIHLVDLLPTGWDYKAGSAEVVPGGAKPTTTQAPAAGGKTELSWSELPALGHDESFELRFQSTPTTALVGEEGIYTNEATATGEDLSGSKTFKEGGTVKAYESTSSAQAELQTPPLTIVKKPDEGEPAAKATAGGKSAYTIEIVNGGKATATEVDVTDLLDEGNVYTAGSASASPATGFSEIGTPKTVEPSPGVHKTEAAWTIASIAAGGKVTITVPVTVEAKVASGAKLHDLATVESHQQPLPTSDGGTLEVEREADLFIHKVETSGEVIPGEAVVYELEVENKGPSNAENVKVADPLPKGTKFVAADSPCRLEGGEVVCELGEVAPGPGSNRKFEVTLEVLPATTGELVNKAEVSSPTKDPEPDNNKAQVENPTEPQGNLTVVKRGPALPLLLGSTFEYEVEVTNAGPSDAVGVAITDPLPAQVEFVSAEAPCEQPAAEPGIVRCAIGAIPAGAPAVKLHFEVKAIGIPAGGGPVKNVATVSSTTKNINPTKVGEAETTVLPAADLSVLKTAPATVAPDGTLTYDLQVENHGPSIAHEVTVTDPLPAGVEFVSASEGCSFAAAVVTCAVQAPEGELGFEVEENSVDFQIVVHVPFALGGRPLTNTASVKGEEADPETKNDSSTVTTTVGPAADLSIVKTMGKAQAGQPLTYTLAIANKGPSTASAVTVKDTLPAGTTFQTAAPSQGTCGSAGQEVTCNLGALAAGGSAQVSITVGVGATVTGNLRNVAKVEGPEPDPDKSNNESAVEGPVSPAPPSAPNLKVGKTVDTSTPQVGTPFEYHVTVSNLGGAEAKNVKVLDTLNGPVKVLSIESDSGKCEAAGSKISCNIPSIPVGKTVHITYSVVAEAAGPLSNTASAQASNGEVAPANNHAVRSVKAKSGTAGKAGLTLTKKASKKVVPGGKKVGFTITLRNGPVALVNATVCDRLPAALVFIKAAGATFVHGEACWQKKYVAAHKVLKLHLTARAVRGYKPRKARNVASASAENAPGRKHASATVHIKPAFAGAPGGVTG